MVASPVTRVTKNRKRDLSSDEVRNRVYHIRTQHHLESFYKAQLNLSKMLSAAKKSGKKFLQLRMFDGDE